MARILNRDLELLVKQLNEIKDYAIEPWGAASDMQQKVSTTSRHANIGTYYIDGAYGGVRLVQIVNICGGIRTVSTTGYGTKRELYYWMRAYLAGMYEVKKAG